MNPVKQNAHYGRLFHFFQFTVMALAISLFSTAVLAEKVNLNQANVETLQYIPGIGPGKSADIVKFREEFGNFKSYEDLLQVPGIGEKSLEDVKKYGTLEGGVSELSQEMQDNPPAKSISASNTTQDQSSG